jgi:membrane protein YqaA with SNARE-associated domain
MSLLPKLGEKVLLWSQHRHAPYYLMGWSFAESSVFPVPPDLLLISMSLAKPESIWRYAAMTTLFSVLGGMLGYFFGYSFFHLIEPYINQFGYMPAYQKVSLWFHTWGFYAIFFAGIVPIPYKIFTIGAGATHMVFWPFVFASIVGRALRFYLVSTAMYFGGERLRNLILTSIDRGGALVLALLALAFILHYLGLF